MIAIFISQVLILFSAPVFAESGPRFCSWRAPCQPGFHNLCHDGAICTSSSGWAHLRELYKYRELVWALALKELRIRYKRSSLGFLWALLNPLLMMLILTAVFS